MNKQEKEGRVMRKKSQTEPKGDEGRLLTDTWTWLRGEDGEKVHVDAAPIMNYQRDLTSSIKDAEIAELKEQVEYMHEAWEVLIEVTEAECQEKIARIRRELEEMFEPTVPMSISYEKWHAYWEEEGAK